MAAIGRAAPTNATVLITGESGVGKELVARTIHRNSLRSRERFVQVNCAAIPEELIESELFGHEKGSFTGATEKQVGKFEQADRGTIFLDEVGDMSAKTQAKVLRVLQEGEVERLGSARTIKVDVRVIAATNKNLEEEIEKGHFREDLYFRLAVIPIHVPPLRERPEDIPLLVRHYMDYFSRENNVRPKRITPGGARRAAALPLEGQHPRAAQHRRAAEHHDQRRHDRRRRSARERALAGGVVGGGGGGPAAPKPAERRRGGEGGHAARVQGERRAHVPGRQAARERLEHLEDRRSDRHAAQQSVQEARAVPDLAGDRRIAARRWPVSQRSTIDASQRARRPLRRSAARREGGRKVRTPQGSAPGNARSGQLEGQWHRKYTARRAGRQGLPRRGPQGRQAGKGEKVR